jgi:hypothetical protein
MIVAQNEAYMHLFTENLKLTRSLQTLEYVPYILGSELHFFNFWQESVGHDCKCECEWREQVILQCVYRCD